MREPIAMISEPERNIRNPSSSVWDALQGYDDAYQTRLHYFLKNKDPQGAYDHLQNDGPQGECIRMNGYAHIYTWLWNELSTIDIATVQKGYIQKIIQLLEEYFYRDNRTEYQVLMEGLEQTMQAWYEGTMKRFKSEQGIMNLSIPTGYVDFPEKVPKNSPLRTLLGRILFSYDVK